MFRWTILTLPFPHLSKIAKRAFQRLSHLFLTQCFSYSELPLKRPNLTILLCLEDIKFLISISFPSLSETLSRSFRLNLIPIFLIHSLTNLLFNSPTLYLLECAYTHTHTLSRCHSHSHFFWILRWANLGVCEIFKLSFSYWKTHLVSLQHQNLF